ncbi:MAG: hypothetical protein ACJ8CR_27865 [Roseiflexaceae bacterium]
MKKWIIIAILLGLPLTTAAASRAPAPTYSHDTCPSYATSCYFNETGFTVAGAIYTFWKANGAVPVFGLPKSKEGQGWDPVEARSFYGQWFERNRLEINPDSTDHTYPILLGRLGAQRLQQVGRNWMSIPREAGPRNGCDFFATIGSTGQNVCNNPPASREPFPYRFYSAWHANGLDLGQGGISYAESLALWGLPLSNVQIETNTSGDTVPTQWFERARFEWHGSKGTLFGLLGNEINGGATPHMLPFASQPASSARNMEQIAKTSELQFPPLAREQAAIFGFGEGGVTALLTPSGGPADLTSGDVAANPALINRLVLGGLTVVQPLHPDLPPGDYVLSLDPSGEQVIFTGAATRAAFPAVIRELSQPLPHPVALINRVDLPERPGGALQLCVEKVRLAVCALVPYPPSDQLIGQLETASKTLGVDPGSFTLRHAVPLVAGQDALEACASGFGADQSVYQPCQATVLAAPAVADGVVPAPPEEGTIINIGLLVALKDLAEHVFKDRALTLPVDKLPAGEYLVFEVRGDDDLQIAPGVFATRVRLVGRNGDFYLPATSGGTVLGKGLRGPTLADESDAAATVSLVLRGRSIFKPGQFPWPR